MAVAVFLTLADWNALRGPISSLASAAMGREIAIRGNLDVNLWRTQPRVVVHELHIGNPAQFRDREPLAEIAHAEANLRWLPLLLGRLDVVSLEVSGARLSLFRDQEGAGNWSSPHSGARGNEFRFPAMRNFSLRESQVRYQDAKRDLLLEAHFSTEELQGSPNRGRFALNGEGQVNGRRFILAFVGAPLLNVRRNRPYNFNAEVRAGGTHIIADGAITRPFDLNFWSASIRLSGPDLAELYPLTGLALPNTPPYQLSGRLERQGAQYGMPDLAGRVGDSDLRGGFTATRQDEDRLMLEGAFKSNWLNFDDLLTILGAPPNAESASPAQRQMAARLAAEGRVMPDARLDIARVRNMDARVSYNAAQVRSEHFPLRGFALAVTLDDGLLSLDPMTLDLRQGRLTGSASINARETIPQIELDVRLSNARLESVLALSGEPPLIGRLVGRVRLSGSGASVQDAAASASGDITFVLPNGAVREAFAELTGINVTRGLGLLISGDQSKIDIRCGVASFRVRRGIAEARTIVFDTDTMLIQGAGRISLRDETLDLRIEGAPKQARLIRLAAPIIVSGRWRHPQVGVEAGQALGQGGLAAILASLVSPIAAILPFVDSGLADDANCAALLASGGSPR